MIQKAINQKSRYFDETNLFVSKPENSYNKIDIRTRWYEMSKCVLKSQENFQGFMSIDLELHNEVGKVIIPLLVENNPYTAIASSL
jgi:hypothetical protein